MCNLPGVCSRQPIAIEMSYKKLMGGLNGAIQMAGWIPMLDNQPTIVQDGEVLDSLDDAWETLNNS